ncbi:lysophospholipid acyltransferase family protein [Costertonia aggregata]|uniref:Lysophospholipid acyltransferase family protein n=1 Tax=Costertonia aggregata TaxID=343403 RepID=A0A7H9AU63_9FLAO|nr:lysophospholipid acyltransferase family protein [Costertonia aggregata]QLG46994.1 lysophospholipid acyltransferase family protein [Costertonia aggregata]
MQLLVFILAYPLLWLISILPYRLFYAFSDFVYFVLYRIVGYRKKVVKDNLRLVFPSKTKEELKSIEKKFYRHLCDSFLEMVKTMNLSKAAVKKRYDIQNVEVIQEIEKTKSILVVCSHYANWEWNVSLNNYVQAKGYAVYTKISNKYFDAWSRKVRARWNTKLITQEETVKTIVKNKQNNVIGIFGMVSDQSPQVIRAQYWADFMGIRVPVINGAETLARKLDLAVVFLKVSKVKRGYYKAEFTPITTDAKSTEKNQITDTFLRMAEQQIYERPEHYLWTHKRWKHRGKEHLSPAAKKQQRTK